MWIQCTADELKKLLTKEHTECKSECSNVTLRIGSRQSIDEITNCLANRDKVQEGLT